MRWTVHLEGGPRRVNHAAAAVGDKIYSFGGYCTGEDYQVIRPIDVHVLDTVSLRWSIVEPVENYSAIPFQRYGHTVVAYNGRIYLWGGRNDQGACSILYCFDPGTRKWIRPAVKGHKPRARDGHSACVIEDFMYIFGGYDDEVDLFSQDVFQLNLITLTWQHIQTKGNPPRWRDFHSASAIGFKMYVFGGRGDQEGPYHSQNEIYCNEIIYLDTSTMTWVSPYVRGIVPEGRRSHSAFVHKDQLYIFGGYNGNTDKHFGDLFKYSPESNNWFEVKFLGHGPCPRRRQCCCVVGNKLFLFGGTSPDPLYPRAQPEHWVVEGIDSRLMDHADLHVLDFLPSLKTLCLIIVIEQQLDQSTLPKDLRWDIQVMTTNNTISKPFTPSG